LPRHGFDIVTAGMRADTGDLRSYLDVLAAKLSDALPGHVTVRYESGLFKRERRVEQVLVRLGPATYQLSWNRGTLEASADGVPMAIENWLQLVWGQLEQNAKATAEGRAALDRLLAGEEPAQRVTRNPAEKGALLSRYRGFELGASAEVTVEADESAVFVSDGSVLGSLGPGTWQLSGDEARFLSAVVDPQGGQFKCSLYFVTGGVRTLPFGGMLDTVADPQTGLGVGLRGFGEYSLRVVDPAALVPGLVVGRRLETDEEIKAWLRDSLVGVLRTVLVAHITGDGWPVLGLSAHTEQVEQETIQRVNPEIADTGLAIDRIVSLTVSLKEEDEAALKRFRLETRLGRPSAVVCSACRTVNAAGSRYCANCGAALT
jgi:membrane protease subunit (stomatin/prohibitin family)